jgi:eukaryotic-like serine/threonine-protein kinase
VNQISSPPQRFIGRYQVIGELGQGAMGTVLLCVDAVLGREVALKYLRTDLELDAKDREQLMLRMRQEAQAVAKVSHRGIVALHDIGEDEQVGTFLVFERANGPTLDAVLRRGRLTKEGAARLARELGSGLDAAHDASVVHRDIKPGNIILSASGAKIADFGVARLPDSTLTRAGARVGTPAYSAPESVREGKHSALSDQFSMAACLYEALCGRRAYPGNEAIEVARRIERELPLPIAAALGLDSKVDEALLRAMARNPDDRFRNCRELGAALSEALLGAREMLPTLPDEQMLLLHDEQDRSRRIGSAILWILLGAIATAAVYRFVYVPRTMAQKSVTATAPALRKAVLSPIPRSPDK